MAKARPVVEILQDVILGCRQAVRHQTLTLVFVGSNPAIPAIPVGDFGESPFSQKLLAGIAVPDWECANLRFSDFTQLRSAHGNRRAGGDDCTETNCYSVLQDTVLQ